MNNMNQSHKPCSGFFRILAGLMLALLFGGAAQAAESQGFTARSEGLAGTLTFAAAPLKSMTPVAFVLEVRDARGEPLTDCTVKCDLSMPAMPMPENRPSVKAEEGRYLGEAVFTMAGAWRASFELQLPGGQRKSLTFDLPRVLLK